MSDELKTKWWWIVENGKWCKRVEISSQEPEVSVGFGV